MREPKLSVPVLGRNYLVIEKAGYFKAIMNGYFGWTSIWADTLPALARRIKQAKTGGQ